MKRESEEYIAYIKYSGESVQEGLLDARKSAEALLGFDKFLRFFIINEDPTLSGIDFEIPVRIRKGSWEILIPESFIEYIKLTSGIAVTAYITSAANKAGADGFFESGAVKDAVSTLKASFKAVKWMFDISKHTGVFKNSKFDSAKIKSENQEFFIDIPNEKGEYIRVPKKYFDLFNSCPKDLFSKNAELIEKDREMEFGFYDNGKLEKITISEKEKYIFYRVVSRI